MQQNKTPVLIGMYIIVLTTLLDRTQAMEIFRPALSWALSFPNLENSKEHYITVRKLNINAICPNTINENHCIYGRC